MAHGDTTMKNEYWDEGVETALDVISEGLVSVEVLRRVVADRRLDRSPIGKIMMSHGMLTMDQAFEVLGHQASSDQLFGEIAVQLGFVTAEQVRTCIDVQIEETPSLLKTLVDEQLLTTEQAAGVAARVRARFRKRTAADVVN